MIDVAFENKDYVRITLSGNITFEDYITMVQDVIKKQLGISKTIKTLGIANDATLDFTVENLETITQMRDAGKSIFEDIRQAFVVKSPRNTAFAVLTTSNMQSENYHSKIFNTEESAIKWLLS